ncbi:MAG: hypothetical protein CVU91_04145 [Firmicutes bacterium HGW-Firmicutes-16]|nr:MAG: hypothetical protein CVU91_04145 [Firmicutes bacterium HGW-Firmicutes-16]
MQKKLKDVADIKFCLSGSGKGSERTKWLMPINLLENNMVSEIVTNDNYQREKNSKISKEDIIIKRISPSFINYIDKVEDDVYASGNLIIVRAKKIEAKYLAYLLNKNIGKMIDAYSGSTIPSIGRKDVEDFIVPILPAESQKVIGELWLSSGELKKLRNRLSELEKIKTNYLISDFMNQQIGGRKNG